MLNTVLQGDCLEVMQAIPAGSVDMILCDLPYGTTRNKWDILIPFPALWAAYNRIIKPNGAIVLTASQPFTSLLISSNINSFKYCFYWIKNRATGVLNAKRQPLRNVEEVCVFNAKNYNAQGLEKINQLSRNSKKDYENYGTGTSKVYVQEFTNYPKQTLFFDSVQRTIHPTQKPVDLFGYLIKTYTNAGETVLDNCAGSFTTAVACENTGRNWICIEKEQKYCDIGASRIAENRIKLQEQKQ